MNREKTKQLGLMCLMLSAVGFLGSHLHLSTYSSILWTAALLLLATGVIRLGLQVYRGDR